MLEQALTSFVQALDILTNPTVIVFVVVGVLWGSTCGVTPGAGSALALGVVVPFTFGLDAVTAVAFLITISVAVAFANGLPATLLGIPPSPASVFTALDGYALSKRGYAGHAVAHNWAAVVFGQFFSIPYFLILIVPLSSIAYNFLAPELFALYALGMAALVSLTGKNVFKGFAAAALGFTVALIGPDPVSAVPRFDFGLPQLRSGLTIIPAVLGFVTISEIIRGMRQTYSWDDLAEASEFAAKFPGFKTLRKAFRPIFTGSIIGTLVGSVPGLSGTAASVMAYNQAKLTSKTPERFGKGSEEGIASNESSQNAAQAGEMVPTLGLGIPGSDSMVLVLGALLLQGFVPGPRLIEESPELLSATVAGLLGCAIFLLLFGWPTAKLMLKVTRIDRRVILPLAFVITLVGVYSLRRTVFDVFVMLVCGFVGYFMIRYGYPVVAAAVALVLAGGFEENLRTGLLLVNNDVLAFLSRPWTAGILLVALILVIYGTVSTIKVSRREKQLAQGVPPDSQEDAASHR